MKISYDVNIPEYMNVRHTRKLSQNTVALLDFLTSQHKSMKLDFSNPKQAAVAHSTMAKYLKAHPYEGELRISQHKNYLLVWKE